MVITHNPVINPFDKRGFTVYRQAVDQRICLMTIGIIAVYGNQTIFRILYSSIGIEVYGGIKYQTAIDVTVWRDIASSPGQSKAKGGFTSNNHKNIFN